MEEEEEKQEKEVEEEQTGSREGRSIKGLPPL